MVDIHSCEAIRKLRRRKGATIHLIRKASQGLRNRKGRLGILPASFNPPTKAHVALIREAMKRFNLDEVLVLLDLQAMDKHMIGASFEDRLRMLKILFEHHSRVSLGLSNRGLFAEKIAPLRRWYPSPIRFVFMVGFDTILRVMDRKYYRNRKRSLDRLFDECEFLVANRGEGERDSFEKLFLQQENEKYKRGATFFTLSKHFTSVSSSLVRERLGQGRSVKHLVPAPIFRFINEMKFYTR